MEFFHRLGIDVYDKALLDGYRKPKEEFSVKTNELFELLLKIQNVRYKALNHEEGGTQLLDRLTCMKVWAHDSDIRSLFDAAQALIKEDIKDRYLEPADRILTEESMAYEADLAQAFTDITYKVQRGSSIDGSGLDVDQFRDLIFDLSAHNAPGTRALFQSYGISLPPPRYPSRNWIKTILFSKDKHDP